ncbi:MAG: DUF3891 family protein [Planctomycetes bacterium]|nr:DUF3891 family protein [Planctomycetota bacterium]
MIRRDTHTADGEHRWLLISQPEHARLSGLLAERWGAEPFVPLEPRDELLAAVYHHDDGWADWEKSPQVDPQSGRPLAFTEMPLADSLAIWRGSIEGVIRFGDLAPWAVAGHFSALLRSSTTWRKAGGEQTRLAREFLQEQDARRAEWLARWLSVDPKAHTRELAEQGLRHLRFFDALSLWFCCAERSLPQAFEPPSGPPITITPVDSGLLVAEPWPFTVPELTLSVFGRSVRAMTYHTAEQLAAAERWDAQLEWVLRRQ